MREPTSLQREGILRMQRANRPLTADYIFPRTNGAVSMVRCLENKGLVKLLTKTQGPRAMIYIWALTEEGKKVV